MLAMFGQQNGVSRIWVSMDPKKMSELCSYDVWVMMGNGIFLQGFNPSKFVLALLMFCP